MSLPKSVHKCSPVQQASLGSFEECTVSIYSYNNNIDWTPSAQSNTRNSGRLTWVMYSRRKSSATPIPTSVKCFGSACLLRCPWKDLFYARDKVSRLYFTLTAFAPLVTWYHPTLPVYGLWDTVPRFQPVFHGALSTDAVPLFQSPVQLKSSTSLFPSNQNLGDTHE